MDHLWQAIRHEALDIVEWVDDGGPGQATTIVWRFDRHDNALRLGSQLIVREGQWAVFVREGRITDSFGPGRHVLASRNLPILTGLLSLPFGGESPFKAEVYFVATRLFTDLKWGTRHPLIVRDPELGPVRLRGFGSFTLRVNDPSWLIREVTGNRGQVSLETLSEQLRNLIVSRLADALGKGDHSILDLAGRYDELARDLRLRLLEEVQELGLEIPSLLIENLTLPAEVEAALDRRSGRVFGGEPSAIDAAGGEGSAGEGLGGSHLAGGRVISEGGIERVSGDGTGAVAADGMGLAGDRRGAIADEQLGGVNEKRAMASGGRAHRAPPLPPPLPPPLMPPLAQPLMPASSEEPLAWGEATLQPAPSQQLHAGPVEAASAAMLRSALQPVATAQAPPSPADLGDGPVGETGASARQPADAATSQQPSPQLGDPALQQTSPALPKPVETATGPAAAPAAAGPAPGGSATGGEAGAPAAAAP